MSSNTEVAEKFFEACETGKGWAVCSEYCTPDATFTAQSEPLADTQTLEAYTEWMKGLFTPIPNGGYELRAMAEDAKRNNVTAYGVFSGTHTGEGGPVPATGKSTSSDYVYVMDFDGGRIKHLTKIWNSGWALRDLGWG